MFRVRIRVSVSVRLSATFQHGTLRQCVGASHGTLRRRAARGATLHSTVTVRTVSSLWGERNTVFHSRRGATR